MSGRIVTRGVRAAMNAARGNPALGRGAASSVAGSAPDVISAFGVGVSTPRSPLHGASPSVVAASAAGISVFSPMMSSVLGADLAVRFARAPFAVENAEEADVEEAVDALEDGGIVGPPVVEEEEGEYKGELPIIIDGYFPSGESPVAESAAREVAAESIARLSGVNTVVSAQQMMFATMVGGVAGHAMLLAMQQKAHGDLPQLDRVAESIKLSDSANKALKAAAGRAKERREAYGPFFDGFAYHQWGFISSKRLRKIEIDGKIFDIPQSIKDGKRPQEQFAEKLYGYWVRRIPRVPAMQFLPKVEFSLNIEELKQRLNPVENPEEFAAEKRRILLEVEQPIIQNLKKRNPKILAELSRLSDASKDEALSEDIRLDAQRNLQKMLTEIGLDSPHETADVIGLIQSELGTYASRIQRARRSFVDRRVRQENKAATNIQRLARGRRVRRDLMKDRAAKQLQSAWRGRLAKVRGRAQRAQLKKDMNVAATSLQSLYRGKLGRRLAEQKKLQAHEQRVGAATKLQAMGRGRIVRQEFLQQKGAAINMQKAVRGHFARKRVSQMQEQERRSAAATSLQALGRGRRVRQEFLQKRDAAINMQKAVRGHFARKRVSQMREQERRSAAATSLQALGRGRVERIGFLQKKKAIKKIQSFARGNAARRLVRDRRRKLEDLRALRSELSSFERFERSSSALSKKESLDVKTTILNQILDGFSEGSYLTPSQLKVYQNALRESERQLAAIHESESAAKERIAKIEENITQLQNSKDATKITSLRDQERLLNEIIELLDSHDLDADKESYQQRLKDGKSSISANVKAKQEASILAKTTVDRAIKSALASIKERSEAQGRVSEAKSILESLDKRSESLVLIDQIKALKERQEALELIDANGGKAGLGEEEVADYKRRLVSISNQVETKAGEISAKERELIQVYQRVRGENLNNHDTHLRRIEEIEARENLIDRSLELSKELGDVDKRDYLIGQKTKIIAAKKSEEIRHQIELKEQEIKDVNDSDLSELEKIDKRVSIYAEIRKLRSGRKKVGKLIAKEQARKKQILSEAATTIQKSFRGIKGRRKAARIKERNRSEELAKARKRIVEAKAKIEDLDISFKKHKPSVKKTLEKNLEILNLRREIAEKILTTGEEVPGSLTEKQQEKQKTRLDKILKHTKRLKTRVEIRDKLKANQEVKKSVRDRIESKLKERAAKAIDSVSLKKAQARSRPVLGRFFKGIKDKKEAKRIEDLRVAEQERMFAQVKERIENKESDFHKVFDRLVRRDSMWGGPCRAEAGGLTLNEQDRVSTFVSYYEKLTPEQQREIKAIRFEGGRTDTGRDVEQLVDLYKETEEYKSFQISIAGRDLAKEEQQLQDIKSFMDREDVKSAMSSYLLEDRMDHDLFQLIKELNQKVDSYEGIEREELLETKIYGQNIGGRISRLLGGSGSTKLADLIELYQEEYGVENRQEKLSRLATRIQKVVRGSQARRRVDKLRMDAAERGAAKKIQTAIRGRQAKKLVAEVRKRKTVATKIESLVRGHAAKRRLQELRDQRDAAVNIQRAGRGFLARRRITRMREAAEVIQRAQRSSVARKKLAGLKQDYALKREVAATRIQSVARGRAARREVEARNKAATKIESLVRGKVVRDEVKRQSVAATKIQSLARKVSAEKNYQAKKRAAENLQRLYRGVKGRSEAANLREAGDKISRWSKARLERKAFLDKRRAATKIQSVARGRAARREVEARNKAATKIQSLARGKAVRDRLIKNQAAINIQRVARGYLGRAEGKRIHKAVEAENSRRSKAAIRIQSLMRGKAVRDKIVKENIVASKIQGLAKMRLARNKFLQKKKAATTIQSITRGVQARREFLQKKKLAVGVQRIGRGFLARKRLAKMRREERAATKIQTAIRGRQAKKLVDEVRKRKTAAMKIQSLARGYAAKRRLQELRDQRDAAVNIQRAGRGFLARRRITRMREAAEVIQRAQRSSVARKKLAGLQQDYALKREVAATKIQSLVRKISAEKNYQAKKSAAENLQRLYRGVKGRSEAANLREAGDKISRWSKARLERKAFLDKRRAATKIESLVRGHAAKRRLQELRDQRDAAVNIQRAGRGFLARRRITRMREAAEVIQRAQRSSVARKKLAGLQQDYALKREVAATRIQSVARGRAARRGVEARNKAATKIQSLARGYTARLDVKKRRNREELIAEVKEANEKNWKIRRAADRRAARRKGVAKILAESAESHKSKIREVGPVDDSRQERAMGHNAIVDSRRSEAKKLREILNDAGKVSRISYLLDRIGDGSISESARAGASRRLAGELADLENAALRKRLLDAVKELHQRVELTDEDRLRESEARAVKHHEQKDSKARKKAKIEGISDRKILRDVARGEIKLLNRLYKEKRLVGVKDLRKGLEIISAREVILREILAKGEEVHGSLTSKERKSYESRLVRLEGKKVKAEESLLELEVGAARKIQSAWRGKKGRDEARARKEKVSATKIQSVVRGRYARKRAEDIGEISRIRGELGVYDVVHSKDKEKKRLEGKSRLLESLLEIGDKKEYLGADEERGYREELTEYKDRIAEIRSAEREAQEEIDRRVEELKSRVVGNKRIDSMSLDAQSRHHKTYMEKLEGFRGRLEEFTESGLEVGLIEDQESRIGQVERLLESLGKSIENRRAILELENALTAIDRDESIGVEARLSKKDNIYRELINSDGLDRGKKREYRSLRRANQELLKRLQENRAATKIQSLARGKAVRDKVERQSEGARSIQRVVRGRLARQEVDNMHKASTRIQSAWRGKVSRDAVKEKRNQIKVAREEMSKLWSSYKKYKVSKKSDLSKRLEILEAKEVLLRKILEKGLEVHGSLKEKERKLQESRLARLLEKKAQTKSLIDVKEANEKNWKIRRAADRRAARRKGVEKRLAESAESYKSKIREVGTVDDSRQERARRHNAIVELRKSEARKLRENRAATKIQSLVRGKAARSIQSAYKGLLSRRRITRMREAAEVIQRAQRSSVARKKLAELEHEYALKREVAATKIQSVVRDNAARRKAREEKIRVEKLHELEGLKSDLSSFKRYEESGAKLSEKDSLEVKTALLNQILEGFEEGGFLKEDEIHGYKADLADNLEKLERINHEISQRKMEDAAATQIQSIARGNAVRRREKEKARLLQENKAATKIQRVARRRSARVLAEARRKDNEIVRRDTAAINIGRFTKGFIVRKRLKSLKDARDREVDAQKREETRVAAATKIQSLSRGKAVRDRLERKKIEEGRNKAATDITRVAKEFLARRKVTKQRENENRIKRLQMLEAKEGRAARRKLIADAAEARRRKSTADMEAETKRREKLEARRKELRRAEGLEDSRTRVEAGSSRMHALTGKIYSDILSQAVEHYKKIDSSSKVIESDTKIFGNEKLSEDFCQGSEYETKLRNALESPLFEKSDNPEFNRIIQDRRLRINQEVHRVVNASSPELKVEGNKEIIEFDSGTKLTAVMSQDDKVSDLKPALPEDGRDPEKTITLTLPRVDSKGKEIEGAFDTVEYSYDKASGEYKVTGANILNIGESKMTKELQEKIHDAVAEEKAHVELVERKSLSAMQASVSAVLTKDHQVSSEVEVAAQATRKVKERSKPKLQRWR